MHQNAPDLLTEAIREYVSRKHVRPVGLNHLGQSVAENKEPGKSLPGNRVAFLNRDEALAIHGILPARSGGPAVFGTAGNWKARCTIPGLDTVPIPVK